MSENPKESDEYPHDRQVVESPAEAAERARLEKKLHEDEKAAGAVAATGAGCLAVIFSPWIGMILAVIVFVVAYLIHHYH